jgi:hypothetical protein
VEVGSKDELWLRLVQVVLESSSRVLDGYL